MKKASNILDEILSHLAWSLWSELGVAGLKRKHQEVSVLLEELIVLTSVLSEFDPRLRDEALDWCTRYHDFISPVRMSILAKKYERYISAPFSQFSATFNTLSNIRTEWILLENVPPLKTKLSGKSVIRDLKSPSMIHFRIRSLFGLGARSDILSFLLTEDLQSFSASDLLETGYSKRRIAGVLKELANSGIFEESQVRNQLKYEFVKKPNFIALIGEFPKRMVNWDCILSVILPIRFCLQQVQDAPIEVRVIDMANLLKDLNYRLKELGLAPPVLENDLNEYWEKLITWVLEYTKSL